MVIPEGSMLGSLFLVHITDICNACDKFNLKKNGIMYRLSVVIPEGSMLGYLFFLVHITDICNVCDKFNFILSADGTTILSTRKYTHLLHTQVNTELVNIQNLLF